MNRLVFMFAVLLLLVVGIPGKAAIRLDGPGEGIEYPSQLNEWENGGVTMMAWIYVVSYDGTPTLLSTRGASVLYLRTDVPGNPTLRIYTGNSQSWTINTPVTLGQWHHFAVVRDVGNVWRTYLDGVADVVGQNLVDPTGDPHPYFGNDTHDDWLDGRFAAGKIWLARLTPAEIQAEMGSYAPVRTANIWSVVPMRVHTDLTDQSGQGHSPTAMGTLSTEDGPPIESSAPMIGGHLSYAGSSTFATNVIMTLMGNNGFPTRTTTTNGSGDYEFTSLPMGNDYTLTPSKTGDTNSISSFDASNDARYVAGLDVPTTIQRIAADADGDATLTSLDASLIARRVVGLPGSGIVGSWKFLPANTTYAALSTNQLGQAFTAILVGDTSGDWTPSLPAGGLIRNSASFASASAPSAAQAGSFGATPASPTAVTVSLPSVVVEPGSNITIPVTVGDLTGQGVRAYDLQITFNSSIVVPQATPFETVGTLSSGMFITPNANNAGHLIISAFQSGDLSGSGVLLNLKFTVVGARGQSTALTFQDYTDPNTIFHPGFRFNAGTPTATTTNGSVAVNAVPTISASPVTRQAGSPLSNSTIATVNDLESTASGVTVTVNGSTSATVNGVTVSNIVNTAGTVTADVVAICAATSPASFTLTATDGAGATAPATLNVTVNANTPPTLVYSTPQNVIFGGSLNVTPTTASDNGSITGYSVQSVVPALTTAPTVNASGVVSVTNAQPSGSHVITIRATDNCGVNTDAQFTLDVGALPSFAVDDVTHAEGNSGTTNYTFTVTKTGSTALNATVDYASVAGTATPPSDFTAISTTTLTFLPADATKQFTVLVNGDTTFEPNEAFTVHLSNVSGATISDADGTGTITNDDLPSISGRILYGDTATPGKNVTMTLTAPSFTTRVTTTDTSGNYTFANVPVGNNYTVTPSKSGDINGLESLDASDEARFVAGLSIPTFNQRIAGDSDGDGILTSLDASFIARFVVGLPGAGIVGTWKFVNASTSYPALSGDQINQNYTAILVGDTGGNWVGAIPAGEVGGVTVSDSSVLPNGIPTVTVAMTHTTGPMGTNISMPITVGNLTGLAVKAYDLQVDFDPAIVQPLETPFDTAGTRSSGMFITPNTTNPGHLILSAFQATDLSGSGTLINLRFMIVGAPGQVTTTKFVDYVDPGQIPHPGFRFNAGSPAAITSNGSIHVNGPTAANANISGHISDPNGNAIAGAAIRLNGTQDRLTITDTQGNYRFDRVETGGFYTVTPKRLNYHFAPADRSFSLLANLSDAGFTATPDAVIIGNVIETPEYFVRQHYLDFLSREPDESGLSFWSDQILSCGLDRECVERRTINVSAAYFLSIEFQETGGLVDSLYRASYGRRPFFAEFTPDTATVARDVVVGQAGWAQLLESNKQSFVEAWVERPAFHAAYDGLTNEQFLDNLINNTRVSFSASEREALLGSLSGGAMTRSAVLRRIVEDQRFVTAKRNEAFVMMQYFGYLRRDPDESGYQFWLRKLSEFGGNFERAEMVRAFLVSGEYRARFQ